MAQKIVDVCDGCRTEYTRSSFNEPSELDLYILATANQNSKQFKNSITRELCPDCFRKVCNFIMSLPTRT